MERIKPTMKEANIKNDFLKAISGHRPTEVFRVHADIGNDKVGITGWYTKAVIDDVVDDIKKRGVKILKIEKSTDPKHLKESTYDNDKQIAIYDGGEDGLTYIEKRGRGYYGYNDNFDFEANSKAELERKLRSWKYKLISGSLHEEEGGSGGHFSVAQLENLRKEYSSLDKKVVTESRLREIARTLARIPKPGLRQLSGAGIAVLSPLAEIVANEKKKTV